MAQLNAGIPAPEVFPSSPEIEKLLPLQESSPSTHEPEGSLPRQKSSPSSNLGYTLEATIVSDSKLSDSKEEEYVCPKIVEEEVMFVSSTPNRNKKRKLDIPSTSTAVTVEPLLDSSLSVSMPTLNLPQQDTLGMVASLESYHIGSYDELHPAVAAINCPPMTPLSLAQETSTTQLRPVDPTTEPNYVSMSNLPVPASASMHWWNQPFPSPMPELTNEYWMEGSGIGSALTIECDSSSNKNGTTSHLASDGHVSPKTPACQMVAQASHPLSDTSVATSNPNNQLVIWSEFMPNPTTNVRMPAWSTSWRAIDGAGQVTTNFYNGHRSNALLGFAHHQYVSPYQQSSTTKTGNTAGGLIPEARRQEVVNDASFSHSNPPCAPDGTHTPRPGHQDLHHTTQNSHARSAALGGRHIDHLANPQLLGNRTWHSGPQNFSQQSARNHMYPALPSPYVPQVDSRNDTTRKPSLYNVPVWPGSMNLIPTSTSARDRPLDYQAPNSASAPTVTLDSTSDDQVFQANHQPARVRPSEPSTGLYPQSTHSPGHSPNIVVDIAETCQSLLPFNAIAARHDVPVQRVLDTFSAIIQLPLLKNADDRRRHGELAKERLRAYREAKKAMEQDREGRGRIEPEQQNARREKGRPRVRGNVGKNAVEKNSLLRHAVLNNAMGSRGAH